MSNIESFELFLIPDIVTSPPHLEPRSVYHYRVYHHLLLLRFIRGKSARASKNHLIRRLEIFPLVPRLTTRADVRSEGLNATELFTRQNLSWWFIVHINYDGPHCTDVDIQRRTPRWKGEKRGRNKQRRDGKTEGFGGERRGESSARKRGGGQTKLFPLGITLCRWIWDR